MSECSKNGGHCCHIDGQACTYLRDDGPDAERQFVCTLREELGNWDDVHTDPRYVADVKPTMDLLDQGQCGDWPTLGTTCGECGQEG